MRSVTLEAVGTTDAILVNSGISQIAITLAVSLNSGGSGGSYAVEFTVVDAAFFNNPNYDMSTIPWYEVTGLEAGTSGDQYGVITFPVTAVRMVLSEMPTGGDTPSVTFWVKQSGQAGA